MNDVIKCNEEKLMEEFIGGRSLCTYVWNKIVESLEQIPDTIYRGMPLPKHLLKKGYILEEWYGMSHWSLDFNIARNFSREECFSEDYISDIAEELNMSFDDAYDTFVPVIIKTDGVDFGLRTYKIANNYKSTQIYANELEITTFGIDSIINNVVQCSDEHGEYYILEVDTIRTKAKDSMF